MVINLSPKDKYKNFKRRKKTSARIKRNLALILIGCGLVVAGLLTLQEHLVITAEPVEVNLYILEQGGGVDSRHLLIREHIALFSKAVYTYHIPEGASDEPQPAYAVDHIYYPIVSTSHPHVKEVARLARKYKGVHRIPAAAMPELENVAVMVKTNRYRTVDEIPKEGERIRILQGVVITHPFLPAPGDKKMVAQKYPSLDFSDVLVIEPNRIPPEPYIAFGMIGGGGIVMMLGMIFFFVVRRKSYEKWNEGMY